MEQTKIIFISTIIVLVLTLSLVAYLLHITKKKYIYPPYINNCPDYYEKNSYGDCYDKHNIFYETSNICNSENFNQLKYNNNNTGKDGGLCKKKKWAINCKLSWDGITNNSELCI